MKLLDRVKRWFRNQIDLTPLIEDDDSVPAGRARIDRYSILTYAPIWYSVCKMAGHLGQMPKRVQRDQDGRLEDVDRVRSEGLVSLLNETPNTFMTSMDMFETAQKDAVIDGNARLGIVWEDKARRIPQQFVLIHPQTSWSFITYADTAQKMSVSFRSPFGPLYGARKKWHFVTSGKGDNFVLEDEDVIHIKGLQHDGLVGIPLWYVAGDSISQGLTAQEHVSRTLANNGIPGLILEAPDGVLTNNELAQEFIDTFRKYHEGSRNASRTALLRYGVTARQISQSGRDGQLIDNRSFTRDEAFMWTGDMLFYQGGSAYSNQQERDEAYRTHTLSRWVSKWEAEINAKLLTQQKRDRGWRISFESDAVLRGSLKSRLEAYEIARRIGYLSQEEIRRKDGLPEPDPSENFDNPNTTSGDDQEGQEQPAGPAESQNDSQADDSDQEDTKARERRRMRLKNWFRVERERLLALAAEPRVFLEASQRWYARRGDKRANFASELGIDIAALEYWDELLQATECQEDELSASVDALTFDWPHERVERILDDAK